MDRCSRSIRILKCTFGRHMNLALKPNIEKLIDKRIKSGKYRTREDVVAAGVLSLDQQDRLLDFPPGELDQLLAAADAQIERGELLDGEQVFRELRKLGKKRRREA
jgi:antitoxin ParD1/3/4